MRIIERIEKLISFLIYNFLVYSERNYFQQYFFRKLISQAIQNHNISRIINSRDISILGYNNC